MNETIREIVMARDGIGDEEFQDMLDDFHRCIDREGVESAEDALADIFGLEPDYLFDPELGLF